MRLSPVLITAAVVSLSPSALSEGWAATRGELNRLEGPVPAEVVRVVDGDTIEVRAHIWLGQEVTTLVRLNGIDAPELKGKCESERAAALRAKARLEEKLAGTGEVTLRDIRFEKYAGRVMSKVEIEDGEDLGAVLVREGLVRSYGGQKRQGWCTG